MKHEFLYFCTETIKVRGIMNWWIFVISCLSLIQLILGGEKGKYPIAYCKCRTCNKEISIKQSLFRFRFRFMSIFPTGYCLIKRRYEKPTILKSFYPIAKVLPRTDLNAIISSQIFHDHDEQKCTSKV